MPPAKRCIKCRKTKPMDDFSFSAASPDDRYPRCRACRADGRRVKVYGLEPGEFQKKIDKQGGKCPLCRRTLDLTPGKRNAVQDHCHATGRNRKVLCNPCNRVLGYLENPDWYNRAADYLGWE